MVSTLIIPTITWTVVNTCPYTLILVTKNIVVVIGFLSDNNYIAFNIKSQCFYLFMLSVFDLFTA